MRNAMLSCAFVGALLSNTAFLCQGAVAGSNEAVETPAVEAQPQLRLAQNTGAAGKTGGAEKLPQGAEAAAHGEISVLAAAAKAEKGKEARPQARDHRCPLGAIGPATHGLVTR